MRPCLQETLHPWTHCCCGLTDISSGFNVRRVLACCKRKWRCAARMRARQPVAERLLVFALEACGRVGLRATRGCQLHAPAVSIC